MGAYKEIEGDLIKYAFDGIFDVIGHGCNCQNNMGAGIAPQMARAFGCDKFHKESPKYKGDINKLGTIDYQVLQFAGGTSEFNIFDFDLCVCNLYTQYYYGRNHRDGVDIPIDYEALTLCMRKINHTFKGKRIGLPGLIGCGLAGGNPDIVNEILKKELKDCDVTIVYLPKNK